MELRNDLELVSVEFENHDKKAVMTFLDRERKEVRQVNWNKQEYKDGKFVDSPEKEAKVNEWSQEHFGVAFEHLPECVGVVKNVYVYPKFNSLFYVEEIGKFTADMVGQIYQTEVKDIVVGDYAIKIRYDIEGTTYESKHTFAEYIESMKEWFIDPNRKAKVFDKFENKYGVPVERANELIGHALMVEVKAAFGTNYYGDIKKFPKKK